MAENIFSSCLVSVTNNMHKSESLQENETYTILFDFEI